MSQTTYTGIDYGLCRSNIDNETGIRFGVISQGSIDPEAFDDVWMQARDLSYENAVGQFKTSIGQCESADDLSKLIDDQLFNSDAFDTDGLVFPLSAEDTETVWNELEQPFNDGYWDDGSRDWLYENDGYKLTNCLQSDVFVLASPYFTYAQFCSPCVPGGCNLDSPLDHGKDWQVAIRDNRAYCLGHDYFEGNRAPYPVYSVATGQIVSP